MKRPRKLVDREVQAKLPACRANLLSSLNLKEPQPDVRENLKGQRDGQLREVRWEVKKREVAEAFQGEEPE